MNLKFNSARSAQLRSHLLLLGLTESDTRSLLMLLHKWETCSGPEWTVARLKDIKLWFVQQLANKNDFKPDWFKSSNSNLPSHPVFKKLFKLGLNGNAKKIGRIISMLMVYTGYISKITTKAQYKKSIEVIGQMGFTPEDQNRWRDFGYLIAKALPTNLAKQLGRYTWQFSPVSRFTGKPVTRKLRHFQDANYFQSFIDGLFVPGVVPFLKSKGLELLMVPQLNVRVSPGNIQVIQEKGYKARVIAMPHTSLQIALAPLHTALNNVLKSLPTDCTFKQDEGKDFALNRLQLGHNVHAVDLSGATDNFPRSTQLSVLRAVGLNDEADLIEEISLGDWRISDSLDLESKRYVQYTKGQPQGLYASFALFALTHNLVLIHLCNQLHLNPEDSFRVLGDDVIISDDNLHSLYLKSLKFLGVPVSLNKCVSSNTITEFAGSLIHHSHGIIPTTKVPTYMDNNFKNYLSVVGHNGLKYLPARLRSIGKVVLELPQNKGGLGQNPLGRSRMVRELYLNDKVLNKQVISGKSLIPSLMVTFNDVRSVLHTKYTLGNVSPNMDFQMRIICRWIDNALGLLNDSLIDFEKRILDHVSTGPLKRMLLETMSPDFVREHAWTMIDNSILGSCPPGTFGTFTNSQEIEKWLTTDLSTWIEKVDQRMIQVSKNKKDKASLDERNDYSPIRSR